MCPISYSNPVTIILDNNPDEIVGECIISADENMKHYGDMAFTKEVDENLYIYYINKDVPPINNYPLDYISLHKKNYKDQKADTLKQAKV